MKKVGNLWLIAAKIAIKSAWMQHCRFVYSSISQSNEACCTQQHFVEKGVSYQPVAWMKCNGIREHITSSPGFRKLHPGYGPPASSRSLVSKSRLTYTMVSTIADPPHSLRKLKMRAHLNADALFAVTRKDLAQVPDHRAANACAAWERSTPPPLLQSKGRQRGNGAEGKRMSPTKKAPVRG
jgi:hypothetical protein